THLADYAEAIGEDTSGLLKVHTSNFRVEGFTASVEVSELSGLATEHDLPLIVDLGSGLFTPDEALPDEPDIDAALRAGADLVIASGDKRLGGPQAAIVLGRAEAVQTLAEHPLARALRTDKLTLAALEATITHTANPIHDALHIDPDRLRARTEALAEAAGAAVVAHDGRVGGGGAPGVPLPRWAVELPEDCAAGLRLGEPAVVARVHHGRCLVDLRCVPQGDDAPIAAAIAPSLDRRHHRGHAQRTRTARGPGHLRHRHRRTCRSREVDPGQLPDRDGTRPLGRGAEARTDHRPRLRVDEPALGPRTRLRRRARAREVPREHA